MRVLLLNPPGKEIYIRDYFCSKTTKSNYLFHPIDLLGMSGTLAEKYETQVLDCIAERIDIEAAEVRIEEVDPQVIVALVGSVSWNEDRAFLAKEAKKGRRIIAIGDVLHEAADARLQEEDWLEAALDDFTNEDVLHIIEREYSGVTKATYRTLAGEIVTRDERSKAKNFRTPRPRHELFPKHGYRFSFARTPRFATLLTDYGCPYPCTFCVIGTLGFRTRPVEDVLEEIDLLRADGITEFFVMDQTFGIQRERAFSLCDEFEKRGDLSWTAFTRPDHADEEMLAAMQRGGCHTVIMGVESASDELLAAYRKGYQAKSVAAAFQRAQNCGLRTVGTFVIGLPDDTLASMHATLELAKQLELDFMSVNMAVPRFGTDFRARVVEDGLVNANDLVMDQGGAEAFFESKAIDRETMVAFKKKMIRSFYLRPSYLWRRLRSVRSLAELTMQVREGFALLSRNV
ncbi:MAG: anaerobic magnesium-protoporphyrin IX monomethyl ester cyclase [Planctomycetota bacterium]